MDWDFIEVGAVEVDYRQRLFLAAFEEWVIAVKKPLKLTPMQIVLLSFTPWTLARMDFRQWNLNPNDSYDSEPPGLVVSSSESEDD